MTDKDPQALRDTLDAAAEAVREANHQTLPANGTPGLEYPGDAYSAIGNLVILTQRLPQLIGQVSAWLEAERKAGRIAHDSGGDHQQAVFLASAYLAGAGEALGYVTAQLASAQNEAAHLKAAGA